LAAGSYASQSAELPPVALLYHRDSSVRIETIKKLAASGNRELVDDLIRAHSIENYTPVHNVYGNVLNSLSGRTDIHGKSAWKTWLVSEVSAGRLNIDYLPIDPNALDREQRDQVLPFATRLGPEHFEEMASALTAEVYDREKCDEALRYMVANDNAYEVQKFLFSDWLHTLLCHRNIDINIIAYYLNGLANPGLLRDDINSQVHTCLNSKDNIVIANTLNLLAGVEGYSTVFTVPDVEGKIVGLLDSDVPEIATQVKRAIEKIKSTQAIPKTIDKEKSLKIIEQKKQRSEAQKDATKVNKVFSETLTGRVLDTQDQPVNGAIIILCDQNSGIPVSKETYRPFTDEFLKGQQAMDLAYTTTDEKGRFTFKNISAGEYRVVTQSWKDTEQFKGVFEKNGKEIELHGVAEHIKVSSGKSPDVLLHPLGTGILQMNEDAPNDETLLVVSLSPTRADPILGFTGWDGAFIQNMIGGNRMPKGKTTIYGMPEGKVYFAMFAADSVPGWTEGQAEIKPDTITVMEYIPFVNSWSNSRHDPPEHLVPVFEEIKQLSPENRKFILNLYHEFGLDAQASDGIWGFMAQIGPYLEKEIELPSGLKTTFGELMAAGQYVQLQQSIERRQAKNKRQAEIKQMKTSSSQAGEKISYEEAFSDLYKELGEKYPCFEMKGIDWKAVGEEFLPRAKEVRNDADFGLLCMELVVRLEDSHAHLLAGTAKLPDISFPRWDPGFACLEDDQGRPAVYYVDKNSPAEKAGVKIGMIVESINGQDSQESIKKTMLRRSKYIGYSSERYLRYHAYHFFVRQEKKGATVKLQMLDGEGRIYDFELAAKFGVRYLPRLPVPKSGINDSGEISWKMLDDNIGYIYVRRIGNNLISLLDEAVKELRETHGVIIDVRGNSGGGFDSNRAHINFALDQDSQESQRPRYKGPIAVLIDSRCISAGEGWASWFVANHRARLFGQATAGASSRKTTYQLKNGLYKVQFPVKAYKGYLDRPIERLGLKPDIEVSQNVQDLIQGRDTVLQTAKQYLLNEAK